MSQLSFSTSPFRQYFFDREDSVTSDYEKVKRFIHLILIFLINELTH